MRYNPETLRNEYSPEELRAMPVVVLKDVDKLYDLMCTMEYNPICEYSDLIDILPNEEGCTDQARYVLEPAK